MWRVLDFQIGDHFAQYGSLTHFKLVKEKGFGFLEYASVSSADAALNAGRMVDGISHHVVNGVPIKCKRNPKGSSTDQQKAATGSSTDPQKVGGMY